MLKHNIESLYINPDIYHFQGGTHLKLKTHKTSY
jgi:hypothetical protein